MPFSFIRRGSDAYNSWHAQWSTALRENQLANVHLTLEEAHNLAMQCLLTNGCDDENANATADRMIQAEADLCQSHGLFRLPW
jgi:hypothetical protein